MQLRAGRVRARLANNKGTIERVDLPVVSTDRVVSIIGYKSKTSAPREDAISYRVLGGLHIMRNIFEALLRFGEIPAPSSQKGGRTRGSFPTGGRSA